MSPATYNEETSSSKPDRSPDEDFHNPRFERLIETTREVLYRFRCLPTPGFDYINPAVMAFTGYSPSDYYQDPELLFRTTHFADLKTLQSLLDGVELEQPVPMRWIHRDGSQVFIELQYAPVRDGDQRMVALECLARQIRTEAAPQPVERVAIHRKRLLQISQSLAANFSADEILRHILQTLEEILVYNHCAFTIKPDQTALRQLLDQVQRDYVTKNVLIRSLDPATTENEVLESGEAINIRKEHTIMIPIQTNDTKMGVFTAERHYGSPFSDEEFDLAQMCIAYAGLAIENNHLCRKSDVQARLIKRLSPSGEAMSHPFTLNEIGEAIGEEALSLSGADRVAVFTIHPDSQVTQLWSRGLTPAYVETVAASRNGYLEIKGFHYPEILQIANIHSLPETSPVHKAALAEGYQAVVVCPLVFGSQSIASVACYFNQPHHLTLDETEDLRLFSRQAAVTLENTRLYEELEDAYLQTVLSLARTIDARDAYTADHSRRLADWAEATARRLQCSEEEIQLIRWAAMLHDIGKIAIPDSILRKAGPLTEEEWQVMRQHPTLGADIIAPVKYLQPITSIIRHHQEKYDGTGYPDGLQGDEIPLAARIITVVDAYGAMTDERIYRPARSREEATAELKRCAGTHFDDRVVNVFSELIESGYTM